MLFAIRCCNRANIHSQYYAHIHTPIMVSLIRTFHGIWIGLVGGIVLIYITKQLAKLGRRWGLWEA